MEVKNFDFKKIIQDELSLEHVTLIESFGKFISEKEVEVDGEILTAYKSV